MGHLDTTSWGQVRTCGPCLPPKTTPHRSIPPKSPSLHIVHKAKLAPNQNGAPPYPPKRTRKAIRGYLPTHCSTHMTFPYFSTPITFPPTKKEHCDGHCFCLHTLVGPLCCRCGKPALWFPPYQYKKEASSSIAGPQKRPQV